MIAVERNTAAAINPIIREIPSIAKPSASSLLSYSFTRHRRLGAVGAKLPRRLAMFHCGT